MLDVMLDLETMGKGPEAVICSIGAVQFDIETGEIGPIFYKSIDMDSCVEIGMQFDSSTIRWWLKQEEQARNAINHELGVSIAEALIKFGRFFPTTANLWSHASFDSVILNSAYRLLKLPVPWHYRKTRDLRTLKAMAHLLGSDIEETKPDHPHHALDDAISQAKFCAELFKEVKNHG